MRNKFATRPLFDMSSPGRRAATLPASDVPEIDLSEVLPDYCRSEAPLPLPELAEGVRTIQTAKLLADYYSLQVPITLMLYRVIYEDFPIEEAIDYLMRFPNYVDVDFL